jgi:hypothetical protein
LPCAIDTSIWRSSVTICSALNLFFGMTQAPYQAILSQRLVQKSPVRSLAPSQQAAFNAFSKAVFADGVPPAKLKQIIAVAVAT